MRIHAPKPVSAAQPVAAPPVASQYTSAHTMAEPPAPFDFSRIPVTPRSHTLHRHAAGAGPAIAPALVHEVLRGQGRPLPLEVRREAETMLGHQFADVRIHTDASASASAQAVAADAYTVGRQIVFSAGRFDPASAQGRRLLTHELTHAAAAPQGAAAPTGDLRISTPGEPAERHAVAVSDGQLAPSSPAPAAAPALFRTPGAAGQLTDATVNERRVTVPPEAGLAFNTVTTPASASGLTFSLVGDTAAIDTGTTIDAAGIITVAAAQPGGTAHVVVNQLLTLPNGDTATSMRTAPFTFTAIPTGIGGTTGTAANARGLYGGHFFQTFTAAGTASTLNRAHVNERFDGGVGQQLTVQTPFGPLVVGIHDPDDATKGWDLNASATMVALDHVSFGHNVDAGPFVMNASNPTPALTLPQASLIVQTFHNLSYPSRTYGATPVARTTHRRALEERGGHIKAVTSANPGATGPEVVEDYVGPAVFRNIVATPNAVPVTPARVRGGPRPTPTTSTVTVEKEGGRSSTVFSVRSPNLGCSITQRGVFTPGTQAGTVTVRAGNASNFAETTITVGTPAPSVPAVPVPPGPVAPPPPTP
ncbi:DUF4157 domain-containing protein [Massilia sp. CF038]|uniref:eCIS core domain-containing protein n=1 Tax=Massilia sp. CF038 TaxID=1881045 RepID=UPI0009118B08|nr:DUF4157 domain-containing protein [Massilia sp. CF038]SHH09185.1 protein of unknown function [Massilia sp. CF038]